MPGIRRFSGLWMKPVCLFNYHLQESKMNLFGVDGSRLDESRRLFVRDFLAFTGWAFLGSAHLLRASEEVITGDREAKSKDWGKVRGRILYSGQVPERKEVDLEKAKIAGDDLAWFKSTGPILNEEWVVDKGTKAVQWVYVWLLPEDPKGAALSIHESQKEVSGKGRKVEVDQIPTGYSPHAVALRVGQDLVMKNTGPIPHVFNLLAGSKNPGFNVAMPPKSAFTVSDLQAERAAAQVSCPPHPWERMWLRVFDHPYFAITKSDGTFEIPLVPKGKCRLVVWQESMGFKGGKDGRQGSLITVEGGAVSELGDISISPTD